MVDGRPNKDRIEPLPLDVHDRVVNFPGPSDPSPDLPAFSSRLVGRDTEIERLGNLLSEPTVRLVTLTGPGGIGKTRLALAVAGELRDRMQNGAIFIDLSSVTQAIDVVPAIAQALGLRERAGRDQEHQIVEYLRHRDLLLVLDNVEQVVDAAPQLARILRGATGTTFLATSRAPLRIGGEHEFPVHPLPLASADATPDELLSSDAGRLFVERARARDPAFVVDEQSSPLIAEICARVDGLPLAIELAAARSRILSPRQLCDRLDRTLELLVQGDRDAPPRHLTMRDAIAWSYDLLAPEEQRLFRQLAIFSGGFTLDAIEWIYEQDAEAGEPSFSTLDLLEVLLDQSLVVRDVGLDGEPRFRMLETIRAFGLERLAQPEEAAIRDLHARYFRSLTRTLRPIVVTESARAPLDRLATEDANLRTALTWLANQEQKREQESAADFGEMVAALTGYWFAFSLLSEGEAWIARALARRKQIALPDQARLLIALAVLSGFQGDRARAESANAEGLPLSRIAGDAFDLVMALTSNGAALNLKGQYAEAALLLDEGLKVAQSIAEPRQRAAMMGRALANRSVTARGQEEFAAARDLSEDALECIQGHGFDLAETRVLMDLAGIAKDQGDLPTMVAHYQTCLGRTGERGDMRVVWVALSGIASACASWNQPETAVLLYAAAESLRARVGLATSLLSDWAETRRSMAALRQILGDARFSATWAEGNALPLARVLAVAATVARDQAHEHEHEYKHEQVTDQPKAALPAKPSGLTRRERDVLRLLAAGQSDRAIAEALFIGPRTVSWHVGAILGKLGVSTRSQAAIKAHTDGLL